METTALENNISSQQKPSIKAVLTNRSFMVLFSAQFIENIGRAVSGLAIEFLIFELTGSPMLMGILSIVWLSPFVIIAPFAGVYTDRFDQRKLMLGSNIVSCFASIGFVVVYLLKEYLIITSHNIILLPNGFSSLVTTFNYIHVLWPLYVLIFINSSAAAFFFPARSAYTRLIVEKKDLLVANSLGSTVFQIASIVGFVIAGVLAEISYLWSFIFDASTFFVSGLLIVMIFFVGKKPPIHEKVATKSFRQEVKSIRDDIITGYRTIREHPKISYMLVIFSLITFTFGAVNVLFIVILQGEMGLGQTWYGIMQAIMGASGIITAIILMAIGRINRKILLLNITFSFATVAMFLFAIVRNPWGMAAILLSFGVIIVCINVPSSTLIQETIAYEKQGRVFGTQQLVQGIAQLLGMGIVSMIAEYILPKYVLVTSAIVLGVVITLGFILSGYRGLLSSDYEQESTEISKSEILVDETISIESNPVIGVGESETHTK